eukprot:Sspe_Gene.17471::Locus_6205_Transcript_1_1_Confidence_1.000_Length_520::g.17471::m.17471
MKRGRYQVSGEDGVKKWKRQPLKGKLVQCSACGVGWSGMRYCGECGNALVPQQPPPGGGVRVLLQLFELLRSPSQISTMVNSNCQPSQAPYRSAIGGLEGGQLVLAKLQLERIELERLECEERSAIVRLREETALPSQPPPKLEAETPSTAPPP